MRLATVRVADGYHVAVVTAQGVVDLTAGREQSSLPHHCFTNPTALLDRGPEALAEVAQLAATLPAVPLASVVLGPPIPAPRKLLLLAGNYAEHIIEGGSRFAETDKACPRVFMKPPSTTLRGPFDPIPIPPPARFVDWEAELAVVIGRGGKAIPADRAIEHVAGYTVINDVSERDFHLKDRPETREWDRFFDWLNGKWLDGFAPLGPWWTTADEIADPHALDVVLTVNGIEQQRGNTGQMIFHVEDIIAWISSFVTLEPGDLIATGTPAGVGHAKGIRLQPGDVVKVSIDQLGSIENRCVAVEQ
ncbi:MAG: fumarylacetoacetate hydrolase family protein [Fimbriimonadaceae bacterium]|nr:fumarylacetoacetate hydrolase family protein [Fimbriimonadaceae bacterium]